MAYKDPEKAREHNRAYYREHTDEISARERAYRREHADEIREQKRAYRREHADEIRERDRAYRCEHADEIRETKRSYYREHADETGKRTRAYYREHADEIREQKRAYNREHADEKRKYNRAYYREHADEISARCRNYNLRSKYGITQDEYERMRALQGDVCALCGKPETAVAHGKLRPLSVDHRHGDTREDGYVRSLLCTACNVEVGQQEAGIRFGPRIGIITHYIAWHARMHAQGIRWWETDE